MDGLAAFLAARLDEDEAAAKESLSVPKGTLRYLDADEWTQPLLRMADEDRVLRQVWAGRAVLTAYEMSVSMLGEGLSRDKLALVRAYAVIWEDHPDYRAEWKP